jgi:HAD superfamily hydrolase (TIGR01509 family)
MFNALVAGGVALGATQLKPNTDPVTYRRDGHPNIHGRGYKAGQPAARRLITCGLNDLDRLHPVADAIDRVSRFGAHAACAGRAMHHRLIEQQEYNAHHGDDMPDVRGETWEQARRCDAPTRVRRTMSEQAAKSPRACAQRRTLAGAIFDVDGVLVASPHEQAWREALAGYADPARFTTGFYQARVAGKPRLDGARATREGLGVPDAAARAPEYARQKQALIDLLIAEGSFEAFPDAVRFADGLHAAGLRLALASSSKNAAAMLRRLSLPDGRPLLSIFDADLSGTDVPRGKPDPALFLLAAKALNVPPAQCVVVEDAPAGIAAARAGGMASVGIARLGDEAMLRAAEADLVVTSLDQVDTAAVPAGILRTRPDKETQAHA